MKSQEIDIREIEEHFKMVFEIFKRFEKQNITMYELKNSEILDQLIKFITEDENSFMIKLAVFINKGLEDQNVLITIIQNINNVIKNSKLLSKLQNFFRDKQKSSKFLGSLYSHYKCMLDKSKLKLVFTQNENDLDR